MADRNQLRIDRDYDFTESDPLAELTRIMGFDPRVEPAPPMDDDLGIDLERELMGEFEADLRNDAPETAASAQHEPEADFDAVLAASLDEEFSLEADQWQPEATNNATFGPAPAESYSADNAAVDMDFSGQLSPAAEEPAAIEDEPFRDEADAIDAIPDLEAELGELLGALGASHDEIAMAASEESDSEADLAFAREAGSEEAFLATEIELAAEDLAEPLYEAVDARDHDLPQNRNSEDLSSRFDGDADVSEEDPAEAYSADLANADEYDDPYDAGSPHAQSEPRDEILDQLFGSAPRETGSSEESQGDREALRDETQAAFEEPAVSDSIQVSEIDFFADSDQDPVTEIVDGAVTDDADARLTAETDTAEAEFYAGSSQDLDEPESVEFDEPESVEAAPDAEELIFDESEFEAAMVDEFEAGDFTPEPMDEPEVETAPEEPRDDPFAALSSMGLPFTAVPAAHGFAGDEADGEIAADDGDRFHAHGAATPDAIPLAPEIETVEVPEQAVALADDLDIPEIRFENDTFAAVDYDDLESELSGSFSELKEPVEDAGYVDGRAAETAEFEDDFDPPFEVGDADDANDDSGYTANVAIAAEADAYGVSHYGGQQRDYRPTYASDPMQPTASATGLEADSGEELAYDRGYDGELEQPPATADGQAPRNRGFIIAAVVAGLAFAGGAGVLAFSVGGGEDGAPVLVKADDGPVKIRPENPGGVVVPNQDGKVYERVSGGPLEAPSQEKLISGAEEPVELATRTAQPVAPQALAVEDLPGVDLAPVEAAPAAELALPKAEDRVEASPDIESVIANEEAAAVTPRRVRTMIVRPDGTLVPREDPAPALPAAPQQPGSEAGTLEQPAAPAPALAPISAQPAEASAQPAVISAAPAILPATEQPASDAPQHVQPLAQGEAATPARVPVAPSRPGDQPVEIVGEVRAREKLAALAKPAPAAPAATPAASSWSMQIASQPTAESAQSTYVDLARRYGSVLGGRSFNIVKADIAGKGTFYRVRIPAESRSDAIGLCERYKGAGGSCFVSQ